MAVLKAMVRQWPGLVRCLLVPALALALALPRAAGAAPAPPAEYQVKAVFLFNFAQFVEWPASAFADDKAPFVIAVAGADPFGDYLDNLVRGEKIGARPIVVERLPAGGSVGGVHILFMRGTGGAEMERLLGQARGRGILTVGDAENFSRSGGMVRFVMESGKIRLRINVGAAKAADLLISSKLLRWATIVTPEKG